MAATKWKPRGNKPETATLRERLAGLWDELRVRGYAVREWLLPYIYRYGWMGYPLLIGLVARLGQLVVGTLGVQTLAPHLAPSPLAIWYRWDASWYLAIAKYGYLYSATGQSSVNFFPLFPLLVFVVARPLSLLGVPDPELLAGMLLAWGAFLAALAVIYRLALDHFDTRVARGAIVLLATYPFGYFFGVPYTESLYLLLAALVFLGIERRWWWLAGMAALLGSATRSPGLLLGACAVLAYALAWRQGRIALTWSAGWLALSPLGALAYATYCWLWFSDPFAYLTTSESGWRRGHLRWEGIQSGLDLLTHPSTWLGSGQLKPTLTGAYAVLTVIFLLMLIPVWKRLGPVYTLFAAVSVIVPIVTTDTLVSQGRYLSTVFPVFLVAGALTRDRHGTRDALVIFGAIALGLLATMFAMNLEVY